MDCVKEIKLILLILLPRYLLGAGVVVVVVVVVVGAVGTAQSMVHIAG